MGLKGYGTVQSGPAFGQDVLRIKVRGNTALNLNHRRYPCGRSRWERYSQLADH